LELFFLFALLRAQFYTAFVFIVVVVAQRRGTSNQNKPKRAKAISEAGDTILKQTKERLMAEQEARTKERLDKLLSTKK
jgi:hypothetical protein